MAKALLDSEGRFKARTDKGGIQVEIVGKRPQNQPYIRIANPDGDYSDSIDARSMRRLADAIYEALSG